MEANDFYKLICNDLRDVQSGHKEQLVISLLGEFIKSYEGKGTYNLYREIGKTLKDYDIRDPKLRISLLQSYLIFLEVEEDCRN